MQKINKELDIVKGDVLAGTGYGIFFGWFFLKQNRLKLFLDFHSIQLNIWNSTKNDKKYQLKAPWNFQEIQVGVAYQLRKKL